MGDEVKVEDEVMDIVETLERSAIFWGSAGASVFEDITVSRSLCRVVADDAEAAVREIVRLREAARDCLKELEDDYDADTPLMTRLRKLLGG
jgi:hypothetical protein